MRVEIVSSLSLVILACCPSLFAEDIVPTPLSPATMAEMARWPDDTTAFKRNEMRERPRGGPSAQSLPGRRATVEAIAAAAAPPKATGFRAFTGYTPPADVAGAVSARYTVNVTNQFVVVNDRDGKLLSSVSLAQFWSDPLLGAARITDPRIVYDAVNDRWVLITLSISNVRGDKLLIAFTASGDPTGSWQRFTAPFNDSGAAAFADFTIIGQTADAILVSVNDLDRIEGGFLFIIAKSYGATPAMQRIQTDYYDFVPITTTDTSRKLVRSSGLDVVIYDVLPNTVITNPQTFTANVTIHGGVTCGAQSGSSQPLDCGFAEVEAAVQRNGATWLAQSAHPAILVWRISGGSAKVYVIESPDAALAYPSIAVNRAGAALIAYSMFSPTSYPSAGYSCIDSAGILSAPAILKAGEATYVGHYRWGDYTTTVVDPADDLSLWTVQLYALDANNWATWWGSVKLEPFRARPRAVRH